MIIIQAADSALQGRGRAAAGGPRHGSAAALPGAGGPGAQPRRSGSDQAGLRDSRPPPPHRARYYDTQSVRSDLPNPRRSRSPSEGSDHRMAQYHGTAGHSRPSDRRGPAY
eukprot:643294-Hanusia_phi.AAC.1